MWWWLELLATREQQNPVREHQAFGSSPQPRQLPTEGAEHKELLEHWVVVRRFLQRRRAGAWEAGDPDGCSMTLNRKSLLSLSHLHSVITNLTKPCDLPTAGRLVLLQERGLQGEGSREFINPRKLSVQWEEPEGRGGLQHGRPVLRRARGRPTLKAGETGLPPFPSPSRAFSGDSARAGPSPLPEPTLASQYLWL